MSALYIGERTDGKFYARPFTWAGEWDKNGRLNKYYNCSHVSDTKDECEAFKKLCDDIIDGKNTTIHIMKLITPQVQSTDGHFGLPSIELELNGKRYEDDGFKAEPDLLQALRKEYGNEHDEQFLYDLAQVIMTNCKVCREKGE